MLVRRVNIKPLLLYKIRYDDDILALLPPLFVFHTREEKRNLYTAWKKYTLSICIFIADLLCENQHVNLNNFIK